MPDIAKINGMDITVSDLEDGDAPVVSSVTATGFTWRVFNGGGVERTGNYLAQGY